MATTLIAVSGAGVGKAYQKESDAPPPPFPPPGWAAPGFDDSGWAAPIHLEDYFADRGLAYPPADPFDELGYLPTPLNRRGVGAPARWVTPPVEFTPAGTPVVRDKLYRYTFELAEPGVLTIEWCAYARCLAGVWVNGAQVRAGSRSLDDPSEGLWLVSPSGRPGALTVFAPGVAGTNVVALSAGFPGNTWAVCYRISFLPSAPGDAPATCTLRPAAASGGLFATTPFMRRGVEVVDAAQHELCVNGWKQAAPFGAPEDDAKFLWHVPFGSVDVPEDPTGDSNYTPNPDFGQTWDHLLTGNHLTRFRWQSLDARVMDSTATLVLRVRARAEFAAGETLAVTYRAEWDTGEQMLDVTPTDPPHFVALPALALTTAYADYELPVPVEPLTGTPWTPEQLFRMQWGLRADQTSGALRVSSFLIDVTWKAAPAPAAAASGWDDARPYHLNHLLLDSFGHAATADLGGSEQLHANAVRSYAGYNNPMLEGALPPGENIVDGASGYLGDFVPSFKWPGAYGDYAIERPGRGGRDGCLRLTGHAAAVSRWESRLTGRDYGSGCRVGFAFKMTAPSGWPDAGLHVRVLSLFAGTAPWPRPMVTLDVRADGRLVLNRRGGAWPNLAGAHLVSTLAIPDLTDWHYLELNVNPQRATRTTPPPDAARPDGFAQLRIDGADAGNWSATELLLDPWGSSGPGGAAPGDAATELAPPAEHLVLGGDPFYPTEPHDLERWYDDFYVAAPAPASATPGTSIPLQFHGDGVVGVLYPTGAAGPNYAVPHLGTVVGASAPEAVADDPLADGDTSYVQHLTAAGAGALEPLSLVWPPVAATGAITGETTGVLTYQYVATYTRGAGWETAVEDYWVFPYITDTDLASTNARTGWVFTEGAPTRYSQIPMLTLSVGHCSSYNPFPLGVDGLAPPHSGLTPAEFDATDRGLALDVRTYPQSTSRLTQVLIEVLGAVPRPLPAARGRTWVTWWP